MILTNKVLWSNDMSLAVGLKTELDEKEFVEVALEAHLEMTGDKLNISECMVTEDSLMLKLEVK
ncbi:MAG: hypothetical protein JEZ08_15345 [Clostridiales bacterium]|nr:hypothetical protein [Clostridiales bacterium]